MMEEQGILGSGTSTFSRRLGRSAMNRLNMSRIFIFTILASAVMLLITVCFSALKLYILPAAYQTAAFISFAFFLLASSVTIFVVVRCRMKSIYRRLYIGFILVFSAVLLTFSFLCVNNPSAIMCYWVMMMVLGLLPVLRFHSFIALWICQLIPACIMCITKAFTPEGYISIVTINVMTMILSIITYSNALKKMNFKASLDHALSQAETDPMTLLLNRRGLERRIDNIWPHCIRQHSQVAVIMLDIDNFKKYNDTFGHDAGDVCIKRVTGAVRECIKRKTDYAARVGGEEFLILLTGIEPKLAVKWTLDLKSAIDELQIPHADTNFLPYVTVSMGLACTSVDNNTSFAKLREEADKSLYDAKYNGRACLYFRKKAYGKRQLFPMRRRVGNE